MVYGTTMYNANTTPETKRIVDGIIKFLSILFSSGYKPGDKNALLSLNIMGKLNIIPTKIATYNCATNACPGVVSITSTYSGSVIY